MTTIKSVALAGATGALGTPTLQALLDADFTVTALTRKGSTHTFPASVNVAEVDYDSLENLTSALQNHDALVSTLSTTAITSQDKLIDAALAAGVKRFIPSEFGCDMANEKARNLPAYSFKMKIEEEVISKTKGTGTSYTFIFNNAFFDWALDNNFGINMKEKKMDLYDGGSKVYTTTPIPLVAQGIAGVLLHPEATANRSVRIHGTSMTQQKLLELAQKYKGEDGWEINEVDTAELEKKSYENLQKDPGNVYGWIIGFLVRALFAEGYGGDFSGKNDNELLGLPREMSDGEVEEIVRKRA